VSKQVFGSSLAVYLAAVLLALALTPCAEAQSSPFAVEVIEYIPGAAPAGYQDPSAALGKTHAFTPAWPEFGTPAYVVTPFNATYATDDLVAIGDGGRLILRLGQSAEAGLGRSIGVHTGVGLIDSAWPAGLISGPATPYTSFRSADVRVSADGEAWFSLGSDLVFDLPTNWYAQGISLPGAQETPGTAEADFTRPFTGQLTDFDNTDWPAMLEILDGSAGGTWLDLSALPVPAVQYIEFSVNGADEVMFVDAVVAVPEPGGALAVAAIGLFALRRRRA
jgi:MYXO-CTERM domain-containing protein